MRMLVRLLLETHRHQELASACLGLLPRHLADAPRCEREVVQGRQLWKEVELLKDDSDALSDRRHVDALAGDLLTLEEDAPGLDRLQQVDAP
jgi:hypothetical protein